MSRPIPLISSPFRLLAILVTWGLPIALPAAPEDWTAAIAQFEAQDSTHPAPVDGVVFVGSSSIARWQTLAGDFPHTAVIHRGFGGSQLSDALFYLDRLVLKHRPRMVIVYSGENDIAGGRAPEAVAADFAAICARVHETLPNTRVVFVSIKPSPKRWHLQAKFEATNRLAADLCAADPRRTYVDVATLMLTAEGQLRADLYGSDQLHLNPDGYRLWTRTLAPLVEGPALAGAGSGTLAGVN